jgi:hypothetical protein
MHATYPMPDFSRIFLQTKVICLDQSWHAFAAEDKNSNVAGLIRFHARGVAQAMLNAFLCRQKLYSRSLLHRNLNRSKKLFAIILLEIVDVKHMINIDSGPELLSLNDVWSSLRASCEPKFKICERLYHKNPIIKSLH